MTNEVNKQWEAGRYVKADRNQVVGVDAIEQHQVGSTVSHKREYAQPNAKEYKTYSGI